MKRLKVFINGKETNVNALDYLKYCLAIKTGMSATKEGRRLLYKIDKQLTDVDVQLKESDNNE